MSKYKNEERNLQKGLKGARGVETRALSTLSIEGEIPCIVVHPDKKHVQSINHILNPLNELLPERGFNPIYLSDEIEPLQQYEKTFEQLAEDCALGIVILDGLRPNVLLEFGILIGKNKPIIPLQDKEACVAIKSFYQGNCQGSGLTEREFSKLKDPSLGFFSHISDLQGLKVEVVDKDTSLDDSKYPKNVIDKAIDKLRPRIIEEYNKLSLKPVAKISLDYLQRFHAVSLGVSKYYGGGVQFSVGDVENTIEEIKNLERDSGTKLPSQVYSTIASLYVSLAGKTEWRQVHEIVDYYNRALTIYEKLLQSESDPAFQSEIQKKSGDIYWELSRYQDKAKNCKKAIKSFKEALKVRTLKRSPMDYGITQNNLGVAYKTLAEVENTANNLKKAIKACEEALKVRTLERFPMDYGITQNNLGAAYETLAEVENTANNCKKAIKSFKEALKVRTLKRSPMDYGITQNNLGAAYETLAEVENTANNCKKAIAACEEALKVRTLERFPMDYGITQNNLGAAYKTLAEVETKAENCKKAIKAFEEALKVRTLERFPMDYGITQNNLGVAYETLAEVENTANNCKIAITACEEALKVRTIEHFPMQYGTTQNNLGFAYRTLAEVEAKAENCKKATKAYQEALKVFTKEEFPEPYKSVAHNLRLLRAFCEGM
jgi:tetratricopeptide (TPR) repeat protein